MSESSAREAEELRRSPEFRVGDLLLNKLRLRAPLAAVERWLMTRRFHRDTARLAADGRRATHPKVLATACWNFPIYSQTFVYQELLQLAASGLDLRFVYSHLEPRDHLQSQFDALWNQTHHLVLHRAIHRSMFERFRREKPDQVSGIIEKVSAHSGISPGELCEHRDFLQAFSYARLAEAYAPDYLHSYFFYDRSLMTLVAAELLGIPRGISCYADHVLDDYELKLVPLHLEQCKVVVATSERIRDELLALAPTVDSSKIVVKPNAIDAERFKCPPRDGPQSTEPLRLITVCRLEPKKGLLEMIDAVQRLRDRKVSVEWHIVGTADVGIASSQEYAQRVHEHVARCGLQTIVHLEGRKNLEELRTLLESAHVFAAPFVETAGGDKDGVPTALLEGMASGLAVVATTAGSMTEVVRDGIEGRLVPPGDVEALADAVAEMVAAPDQRRAQGAAAVQRIEDRFDIRVCERRFHDRVHPLVGVKGGH